MYFRISAALILFPIFLLATAQPSYSGSAIATGCSEGRSKACGSKTGRRKTGGKDQPETCDKVELKDCKKFYKINKRGCNDLNNLGALAGCKDEVKDRYEDCKVLAGCE
jgi:hypothetical protein